MELTCTVLFRRKITRVVRSFAINAAQDVDKSKARQKNPAGDSVKAQIQRYFNERFELKSVKEYIPEKYLTQNRQNVLRHLYLMNSIFAKDIACRIFPFVKNKREGVCETNAGLGLISTELLKLGVERVRLYEVCAEFRAFLATLDDFPSKMELFNRDMYNLSSMSYLDRHDGGSRVSEMLDGIPVRSWDEDPLMTIIGPMPSLNFVKYLIKSIVLQDKFFTYGRSQVFALMFQEHYQILTSSSEMKLRMYNTWSILFQIFFDYELLHNYCKKSFLPWRNVQIKRGRKSSEENVLLVRIVPKSKLPVSNDHLAHLYYFIRQAFKRGRERVIPVMEKWLPGIGARVIVPPPEHEVHFSKEIDIFTEFGKLTPFEILHLFLIMLEHPSFNESPFIPMMESHLVKDETIDSDLVQVDESAESEKPEPLT